MSENDQSGSAFFAKVGSGRCGLRFIGIAMVCRVRHCIECPKCCTRYLVGFSPYRNGSYLVPLVERSWKQWMLYCSCGSPPTPSRWTWDELKAYEVSQSAHTRGYGAPEEIVAMSR